jgi:hypothetical protein
MFINDVPSISVAEGRWNMQELMAEVPPKPFPLYHIGIKTSVTYFALVMRTETNTVSSHGHSAEAPTYRQNMQEPRMTSQYLQFHSPNHTSDYLNNLGSSSLGLLHSWHEWAPLDQNVTRNTGDWIIQVMSASFQHENGDGRVLG